MTACETANHETHTCTFKERKQQKDSRGGRVPHAAQQAPHKKCACYAGTQSRGLESAGVGRPQENREGGRFAPCSETLHPQRHRHLSRLSLASKRNWSGPPTVTVPSGSGDQGCWRWAYQSRCGTCRLYVGGVRQHNMEVVSHNRVLA